MSRNISFYNVEVKYYLKKTTQNIRFILQNPQTSCFDEQCRTYNQFRTNFKFFNCFFGPEVANSWFAGHLISSIKTENQCNFKSFPLFCQNHPQKKNSRAKIETILKSMQR